MRSGKHPAPDLARQSGDGAGGLLRRETAGSDIPEHHHQLERLEDQSVTDGSLMEQSAPVSFRTG